MYSHLAVSSSLALACFVVSCAASSGSAADGAEPVASAEHAVPAAEPIDGPQTVDATVPAESNRTAHSEPAAVFELPRIEAHNLCSDPVLHGLDADGTTLWSRTFLDGQVRCSEAETNGLAQIRIEHPYLGLRQGTRFPAPPTGSVRVDHEFFGDCLVELNGLTDADLKSHLVMRNVDRESYTEAVFNGRSEILDDLGNLEFQRLPIGRYVIGLFRGDPFGSSAEPYLTRTVSIRPCQESVIELAGNDAAQLVAGRSDWRSTFPH